MPAEKYNIELTAEEAELLSMAASARANVFTRSIAGVDATPEVRGAWNHNAILLRNLATRLAKLKKHGQ